MLSGRLEERRGPGGAPMPSVRRGRRSSLSGHPSIINTMFRDSGPLCVLQMSLIRILLIWPLRVVAPTSLLYCASWALGYPWLSGASLRPRPGAGPLGAARALLRRVAARALHAWLITEFAFFVFFLVQKRRLSAQKPAPPQLLPGQALEIFRRCLAAVYDIHGYVRARRPAAQPREARRAPSSSFGELKSAQSVEGLLRRWDSTQSLEDTEELAPSHVMELKLAEISGWCLGAQAGDIRRGNLEEWLAWAFFNSPSKDTLVGSRRDELNSLMQELETWAELDFEDGYNPRVRSMRLTVDPIPAIHRPLIYYMVTAYALPTVQKMFLSKLDFVQHKSGTLTYWRRPGDPTATPRPPPMVFCHGIGVAVLPYVHLLEDLVGWDDFASRREIFVVSIPHIAMRIQEDAHSSSEMVACIADMMTSWNVPAAHFVGHSFGSVVVTWMLKASPQRVLACTFMDPVCFLLVKPDVNYNFLYRKPDTPTRLLTSYFVARELYIAYSMARNFFWYQNMIWPEEIPPRVPFLVTLSGKDSIVPAHSVHRFLMAYQRRQLKREGASNLRVMWFPHLGHGEINFGLAGDEATGHIVEAVFDMERQLGGWAAPDAPGPDARATGAPQQAFIGAHCRSG